MDVVQCFFLLVLHRLSDISMLIIQITPITQITPYSQSIAQIQTTLAAAPARETPKLVLHVLEVKQSCFSEPLDKELF